MLQIKQNHDVITYLFPLICVNQLKQQRRRKERIRAKMINNITQLITYMKKLLDSDLLRKECKKCLTRVQKSVTRVQKSVTPVQKV